MPNDYFQLKQFTIHQCNVAMKVGTDSVILGAWTAVDASKKTQALDIGGGGGILAIMLAQRSTNIYIDGVEIDKSAFIQAQENVNLCPWSDRICLYNEPFQEFAKQHLQAYDLIISNPPYFIQSLTSPDEQRSIARHSNSLNQDDLLKGVLNILKPDGRFAVVFPINEGFLFINKAEEKGLYCNRKTSVKANPKKEAKRLLLELSRTKTAVEETELCIDTGVRHQYSPEYIELTKDFYLKF
ncbi:MAG: methyltransferase [Prevotellaceae bacterium]|jgi:tRNA1Val (adenine37-N6)-methyltransferase|nr:methyltransferase [Prevotellaceae bacterium]